ncbi:hypothetical protein GCM10027442_37290 [Emticicia fontis]
MNGYILSRRWFDWAFENPDLNTPTHTALFMWVIEKWNRLGQKEKFGLPSSEAMEALGIHSITSYKKVFNNLVEWGFIEVIQESKNQYSSTIIALSNFDRAPNRALDKALIKHPIEQEQSTQEGTVTINKQENEETTELLNQEKVNAAETDVSVAVVEVGFDEALVEELKNASPPQSKMVKASGSSIDFEEVWNLYDKKLGDRQRCGKKWRLLSDKERHLAWEHIPKYVLSTPDKKYRANLETYLNQKRWNNEIIQTHAKSGNRASSASAASAKPFLEKPRIIGGDPVRKNIFGKEEKSG